ncbi:RNA-directed DNA polymerase, eukaryota, reverse transcriptase zinc-binding domain protein [Tanacetum coccineum]|uniref:RNA-directed DNA polymerase, eukaryota, reverse transcriptase zinc-binding domain protein n=1 Tax=Tanacetum coccineum TaxID=301880 RepID=A0ABQ5H755_9ASTR
MLSSPNSLWVKVIKAFHGQDGGFDSHGCKLWNPNSFLERHLARTKLGTRNLAYFLDLLNEIGDVNIDVAKDTCFWSLGSKDIYMVKKAWHIIDLNTLLLLTKQTTWDNALPRKVNIFMWRLSLDHLPHRVNLSSRGMDIMAISCPSCNATSNLLIISSLNATPLRMFGVL